MSGSVMWLAVQMSTVNGNVSFSELAKYPYELLCRKTELPDGIDVGHKEVLVFHVIISMNF